jgi:predicted HicB family RNase H-like nuclease
MTFEEFNALVQPTDYFIEKDNLFLYAHFSGIQIEATFSNNRLVGISFVDTMKSKYYYWGNPEHKGEHYTSTTLRNIVEKIEAVNRGEPYSTSVEVEVDLDDHEWLQLMTEAHEKDITLNQYVEQILGSYFRRLPNDHTYEF